MLLKGKICPRKSRNDAWQSRKMDTGHRLLADLLFPVCYSSDPFDSLKIHVPGTVYH